MGVQGRPLRPNVKEHPWQPKYKASHVPRFNTLRPFVEGKSVLDIGAACGMNREDWLHRLVDNVATRSVAVDILAEPVEKIRAKGFEAVQGDAQDLHLDEKFDVVFAAELIEHLDNFHGFLDSARRHLNPGGKLVLTTPNAFCFSNFIYRLGTRKPPLNTGHTVWFCEGTIRQLLERNGWKIVEFGYIEHETPGAMRRIVAGAMRAPLPKRLAWRTMYLVAEPQ
jgi:2-polyprenyl-3-methyl-5-hydroxy-6-metoxy-1,4-benzoquinol methylase